MRKSLIMINTNRPKIYLRFSKRMLLRLNLQAILSLKLKLTYNTKCQRKLKKSRKYLK
jgi:hypothetical protein